MIKKIAKVLQFTGVLFIISCQNPKESAKINIAHIDRYNVSWDSPSEDYNGSMPLGNGDVAANVWIEPDGELVFFISKTDSRDDNGRLSKVGKVRISFGDDINMENFSQVLHLRDATLKANFGDSINKTGLRMWIDANQPVIHVVSENSIAQNATASIELVRPIRKEVTYKHSGDLLSDKSKETNLHQRVITEPDSLLENQEGCIGWYHRNIKSAGPNMIAELQGLDKSLLAEPLLNRTFGGVIKAENGQRVDDTKITSKASKKHYFKIYIHTEHPATGKTWLKAVEQRIADDEKNPNDKQLKSHKEWWKAFWNRSKINITANKSTPRIKVPLEFTSKFIDAGNGNKTKVNRQEIRNPAFQGGSEAFIVSRAYNLQRYIDACAGRGKHPIKFNGSIFTVPFEGDADYRKWGGAYWWQNTRLPYTSMCVSGDFDLMQALFRMYAKDLLAVHKNRTKLQTGKDGAFVSETLLFWGPQPATVYGWTALKDREADSNGDKLQESFWHKWEWVSGLELSFMMLDYYNYTLDREFLDNTLLPAVHEFLTFFDTYYKTNEEGQLIMYPAQALEEWFGCTNPAPEVAGLHSVCIRLLNLPEELVTEEERSFWLSLQTKLPPVPTRMIAGKEALSPAGKLKGGHSRETPELYPVFPFRLVSFEKENANLGLQAFEYRASIEHQGWAQDNIFMAYLGLGKQAQSAIAYRAQNRDNISRNHNNQSRFPVFWGPNRDWIPDQDHGGILTTSLQAMLLQVDPYSDKLFLLPAWPLDWDANFKLHAPSNTIIEGKLINGKVINLKVTPESRRKDITIFDCQ